MGRRARAKIFGRALLSLAMLGLLLRRVHLSSLIPDWGPTSALWLLAGIAATGVGIVLSTWRWQRVLAALEVPARIPTLLSHYLAGLFVANFLPSTIGGDVLRVRRLAAGASSVTPFASVVLERLTGWLVLPVITFAGLAVNPGLRRLGAPSHIAEAIAASTLVLLALVLTVGASPRLGRRLGSTTSWLRFVRAVHLGLARFRQHPSTAASVLAVGFAYQLTVVGTAWLAARTLGIDIGLTAALAFVPIVAIAQVLPISLGGLGVREGAFYLFLNPLGVSAGQAVALGLLVYGMNLAVSLLGAPAFAVGGGARRSTPSVAG